MTLNDATFHEASEALASRMAAAGSAVDKQIALGFSLAVCREPTTRELAELVSVYGRLEQIHQAAAETAQQNTAASETAETTSNEVPAPSSKDQTSTTEERDQGSQPESTDSDQPTIAEEAPELNLSLVSIASVLLNLDEVLNK